MSARWSYYRITPSGHIEVTDHFAQGSSLVRTADVVGGKRMVSGDVAGVEIRPVAGFPDRYELAPGSRLPTHFATRGGAGAARSSESGMRPWDWLLIALLGLLVALVILAAIGFAGTMAFVAVIGLVALIRAASSRNRDRWRLLGLSTFGVVGGALLPPAWLITAYEWPDTSAAAAVPTWVWPVVVIPSYLVVLPAMTMLALGSIRWLTSRPPTESSWIKWSYGFTRPAAVVATFGFATWATHAIYVFNGILR